MRDTCTRPDCDAPNHCPVCHVHHPVDSMVRWCESRAQRASERGAA